MKVIVNDANILIDLVEIELITEFFSLAFYMNITDSVLAEFDEESYLEIEKYITEGKLELHAFDPIENETVANLKKIHSAALSFPDCSCLYLSRKISAVLLTGDKPLRTAAKRYNIHVHGVLWVFDHLIQSQIITTQVAHDKLTRLMGINQRLPAKECEKRLNRWKR
jgi:predicted nucleic acid-binding protein